MLKTLTRRGLMVTLGLAEPERAPGGVSEFTESLYAEQARQALVRAPGGVIDDAPHGEKWHTSFHASQFPSTLRPCGRQAMYRLMDVPPDEPTPSWLIAVSDAGKDIERQMVLRWHESGRLLSNGPDAPFQTGWEDPDHWLTCSVDAVLDPRSFSDLEFPIPVDVKGKDHDVVAKLRSGARAPDSGHVRQIMVQSHFVKQQRWQGLGECEGGVLLYVSRARPLTQHEVFVPYDGDTMAKGLETLAAWRTCFEDDVLPDRPKSWRWTDEPCKWCEFKRVCKVDLRNDTGEISKSAGMSYARSVRETYDESATRRAVLDRWEDT